MSKRNFEAEFINHIIAEYDFDIRLEQTKRLALIRDGFASKLGFNSDGDSAITVQAQYSNAWPRLLLVFRKMGFDVIDLDQSSGIMFVLYNGDGDGWFSRWFASNELPIDEDNYRIFIERSGDVTHVTFKDEESVALPSDVVSQIFPVFAEYMAADDLDI